MEKGASPKTESSTSVFFWFNCCYSRFPHSYPNNLACKFFAAKSNSTTEEVGFSAAGRSTIARVWVAYLE